MGPVFNPANAVTASRYLTIPAALHYFQAGSTQGVILMLTICAFLDLFDGALARAFNCASGFGEFFDAITDGICYTFFLIAGTYYGDASWVPILIVVGLGGLNSVFRAIYARRAGRATNYRSFAMERCVGFIAYMTGAVIVGFEGDYYPWGAAGLMIIIMAHDTKRMLIDPVPS